MWDGLTSAASAGTKVEFSLSADATGLLCVGVQVLSADASVGDYLDAFEQFQAVNIAPCDGCTSCCWERAPLTAPDALGIITAAEADGDSSDDTKNSSGSDDTKNSNGSGDSDSNDSGAAAVGSPAQAALLRFIRDRAWVDAEAADVCLRRLPAGSCIYLDTDSARCTAYAIRPLVCRTYVCLPSDPAAEALRRQIVNEGENELLRLLGEAAYAFPDLLPCLPPSVAANWRGFRARGFTGKKNFADVFIREVVRQGLWEKLFTPDPPDSDRNPRRR